MKRKLAGWAAGLLSVALAFSLTACGGGGEQGKDAGGEQKKEVPAGTYDVGDFTVVVPEGWSAIPVPLVGDEMRTDVIDIYKGEGLTTEEDMSSVPGVEVSYAASGGLILPAREDFEGYDEDLDLSAAAGLGGFEWTGFKATVIAPYEYLKGTRGEETIGLVIQCTPIMVQGDTISITDQVVQDIVTSVTPK